MDPSALMCNWFKPRKQGEGETLTAVDSCLKFLDLCLGGDSDKLNCKWKTSSVAKMWNATAGKCELLQRLVAYPVYQTCRGCLLSPVLSGHLAI